MLEIIGVALVAIALWPLVGRANEVFCLSFRDGKGLIMRGRITPSLRDALIDGLRRSQVKRATLRAVRRDQRAVLITAGLPAGAAQRLRNIFDSHGGPRLALNPAGEAGPRNLGQRLGWSWLAFWLRRR